ALEHRRWGQSLLSGRHGLVSFKWRTGPFLLRSAPTSVGGAFVGSRQTAAHAPARPPPLRALALHGFDWRIGDMGAASTREDAASKRRRLRRARREAARGLRRPRPPLPRRRTEPLGLHPIGRPDELFHAGRTDPERTPSARCRIPPRPAKRRRSAAAARS